MLFPSRRATHPGRKAAVTRVFAGEQEPLLTSVTGKLKHCLERDAGVSGKSSAIDWYHLDHVKDPWLDTNQDIFGALIVQPREGTLKRAVAAPPQRRFV